MSSCKLCSKPFRDGDLLVSLSSFHTNEKRGDRIAPALSSNGPAIHFAHLRVLWKAHQDDYPPAPYYDAGSDLNS